MSKMSEFEYSHPVVALTIWSALIVGLAYVLVNEFENPPPSPLVTLMNMMTQLTPDQTFQLEVFCGAGVVLSILGIVLCLWVTKR